MADLDSQSARLSPCRTSKTPRLLKTEKRRSLGDRAAHALGRCRKLNLRMAWLGGAGCDTAPESIGPTMDQFDTSMTRNGTLPATRFPRKRQPVEVAATFLIDSQSEFLRNTRCGPRLNCLRRRQSLLQSSTPQATQT